MHSHNMAATCNAQQQYGGKVQYTAITWKQGAIHSNNLEAKYNEQQQHASQTQGTAVT